MYKKKTMIAILIFLSLFLAFPLCNARAWEAWPDTQKETDEKMDQSKSNIGSWLASFYSNHISPVDGSRCPSIPSCSTYSIQAFKTHGFFIGWMMTVDRLLHEGEEVSISPLIYINGEWKIFDPIENNDFWWFHEDEAEQK
jgi:hypothetical protein